jgi:hypothetical protein
LDENEIGIPAGEPVWTEHEDPVELSRLRTIPEAIEPRSS